MRLSFTGCNRTAPGQTLLDIPDLDQGFLGNRQRFDENSDFSHLIGHPIHVLLVVDDELRHEAMPLLDTALLEVAGEAKILATASTCRTIIVGTGSSYHRHYEVANFDPSHLGADFDNFAKGFMADHQVLAARRRCAIFKSADFSVRTANTGFNHAQLDIGG